MVLKETEKLNWLLLHSKNQFYPELKRALIFGDSLLQKQFLAVHVGFSSIKSISVLNEERTMKAVSDFGTVSQHSALTCLWTVTNNSMKFFDIHIAVIN